MKVIKKFTAEFLVLILIISTFITGLTVFSESKYKNGDIIKFGSYPQSRITDASLISELNDKNDKTTFKSLGYYYGEGTNAVPNYESIKSGDYMLYKDTVYGGIKYRGIIINEKRPFCTYCATNSYKSTQKGYETGTAYWFRYDPIEWQILDIDTGLVMSNAVLDAQPFNNTTLTAVDGYNSYYSNSSLRSFISNDFIKDAFNNDTSSFINIRDDLVFIPTKNDILFSSYGFSNDAENINESGCAQITDYDIINALLGVSLNDTVYAPYWLDATYSSTFEESVFTIGHLQTTEVYQTCGVRVAAYLDIESIANTYSLNYYSDGELIKRIYLNEGDTVNDYTPVKEHYGFEGWDYEIPEKMPGHDITVNAEWLINSNDIIFNSGEGNFKDGKSTKKYTVNYGEELENYIEEPTRTGFVFDKWDNTVPETMPDNKLEFNAVWTEAEDTPYVVNVYKEKSTGSNNNTVEYDLEALNMTGRTNSIAEYTPETLDYFNFDSESSNISETIKADGTTVLNVYYTRKTGIISFNFGEGFATQYNEFKYGQQITYPTIPDKDGYAGKWNKTDNIYDGTQTSYNVEWTAGSYSISFDTDGGTAINSIVADCDSPVAKPENPTKEGYKFIIWNNEFPETMPAGGLQLKAIWEKETYYVYYIADGVTTPIPVLFDEKIPTKEDPDITGYKFIKWSDTIPEKMPSHDITVNAVLEPIEYKITWKYDGKEQVTYVKYGEKITPYDKATKEGYKFIKWEESIPDTMPADNLTFNAKFEKGTYKLSFYENGEFKSEVYLLYGDPVKAPEPSNITGYKFEKWENLPDTMPGNDITVNGIYSKNEYDLTYNYGGKTKTFKVKYHDPLPAPDDLDIPGYTFVGWDGSIPKSMPAENLSFNASYVVTPVISIAGCRNRTEKYKITITFHAEYSGCESSEIIWYDDNGNVIGSGESITITKAKSSYSVQAKIIKNGKEAASSGVEKVTVKNKFFDKIISFFGRLFAPKKYIIDQR